MNVKVRDFIGKKNIFFGISIAIIVIGIVFNIIFGAQLDIQFTGGTILKYSYSGDVDQDKLEGIIQELTSSEVTFSHSENLMSAGDADNAKDYVVAIQFSGTKAITLDEKHEITTALTAAFPDNSFKESESNAVEPTMGLKFFLKCLVAVALAGVLMVFYVTIRFKKIGGLSAGVMALVALLHDVIIVYFTFVFFNMPIDSNFMAVVLAILGYSLNDTIIIYDRVRENRIQMGRTKDLSEIFNISCSQVLRRTIMTSVCTLTAIATVVVFAFIFNLDSVITFSLPMMLGIVSGCYSTIFIAGPLWVMWQNHKAKVNKAAKRA